MHGSRTCLAILLAAATAQGASAQDASQWNGFYVGATYADGSADQAYSPAITQDLEGNGGGLMVGYNHATGPWVIGGELAYSQVEIGQTDGDPYNFESFFDLKARGGYSVANILVYATLGFTLNRWNEDGSSFDGDGLLYGIGADFLVSPQFILGAEYTKRDITSDWFSGAGSTFDADVETFTIRAGFRF